MIFFLDESGDLGWSFDAPYRRGGSSRYLTISVAGVLKEQSFLFGRLIRNMYRKFSLDPKKEHKWIHMTYEQKLYFATQAKLIIDTNESVKYFSITVYKPGVKEYLRQDPNLLYNYLIKLLLLEEMIRYPQVQLYPDTRNIKQSSGGSLQDYLQTELYYTRKVSTHLVTIPTDSAANKGIQFADMLSGLIQNHYEDRNSIPFSILKSKLHLKALYFDAVLEMAERIEFVELIEI